MPEDGQDGVNGDGGIFFRRARSFRKGSREPLHLLRVLKRHGGMLQQPVYQAPKHSALRETLRRFNSNPLRYRQAGQVAPDLGGFDDAEGWSATRFDHGSTALLPVFVLLNAGGDLPG